ncbi:MAG: ATP-binding protein [Candidatus Coproplasma sp.]
MERKIEQEFLKWKNSANRKPLLIYGARQIGKTYSTLDFGKKYYVNVAYCNFEYNKELSSIFEKNLDTKRIISSLSVILGMQIDAGRTLIIFDEIQACESALTSLKYFNENANEYHIMAAGSLLGLAINRGKYSFPVGKVDMLNMYPLSFDEFLVATGNQVLKDMIIKCAETFTPMEEPLHQKALDLYRTYLVVGGYPSAVNEFILSSDYNRIRATQSNISNAYIADMAKYSTPKDMVKSMEIYDTLYSQLSKENTKFQYSVINSKARATSYENALAWLKAAHVVLNCIKVNEGKYPLSIYEDFTTFKIYYSDIGLLTSRMSMTPNGIINDINISDKAKGMMAESFVAEQLTALGYPLHYWTSQNSAEIDFVIQQGEYSIPVEVKSADNVRAKSLKIYMEKYNPPYAIRISTKNFGYENGIKSIPLYAVFCL